MRRMSANGYAACFDVDKLSILCAQYDRRIDELGAENKRLRGLVTDMWRLLYDLTFEDHEVPWEEIESVHERINEMWEHA